MKKNLLLLFTLILLNQLSSLASPPPPPHHQSPPPPPPVVVIDNYTVEHFEYFSGCNEHYLIATDYVRKYSDGTQCTTTKYSIINTDGVVLGANLDKVEHLLNKQGHYFLTQDPNYGYAYRILDNNGYTVTHKSYNYASIIDTDRILVGISSGIFSYNYGIIDFAGNEIMPVKYSNVKFGDFNNNILMTKLNNYWGLISIDNEVFAKNEYDSIKELHNCYLMKKGNQYDLANFYGQVIIQGCSDVKKKGEFIIIKKDNKYGALDMNGNQICEPIYKKITLERNSLYGTFNGKKVLIEN